MKNLKLLIGAILFLGSPIAAIVLAIKAFIIRFNNPDMTSMRFIVDNPDYSIAGILIIILMLIGKHLIDSYNEEQRLEEISKRKEEHERRMKEFTDKNK